MSREGRLRLPALLYYPRRELFIVRIGIPRALYYYRYGELWKTFFSALGCEVVISPKTDRAILNQGTNYAIDESCLSAKIYLGHCAWLLDRCDYIFVPRIADMGHDKEFCLRFRAMPDVVYSTFRDEGVHVLSCDLSMRDGKSEAKAFTELGKKLGFRRHQSFQAYMLAKQAEHQVSSENTRKLETALAKPDLKVLICGHAYNIYDRYIGRPVVDAIYANHAIAIPADWMDRDKAWQAAADITDTMPWMVNRELAGTAVLLHDKVDGIVLLSSFSCGPDSMTDEILTRRLKNIPILTMTLDGQDATAGMETRIESFIDILHLRKDGTVCL